jgi:hypothetical protein
LPDEAFEGQPREAVRAGFEAYFGGWDAEYRGGVAPPERAEIFCQCVDSRIESLELTEALHAGVREWAGEFDALRECAYCETEFRPYFYNEKTAYVCSSEACELRQDADVYEVSVEDARRADVIMTVLDFDTGWDYLVARSSREDLSPSPE